MAKPGVLADINEAELEKLAMLQCTDEEIAAWFGVTRERSSVAAEIQSSSR